MKKKLTAFAAILLALLMIPVFTVTASDRVPYKGIDVSKWQTTVNWAKAKSAGVDFAILRVYANGKDTKFEDFYAGATAAGVWVGAYVYMYATTPEEAVAEAEGVIAALDGRPLEFPLFLDVEDERQKSIGKSVLTDMIISELEIFKAAGYRAGIYTSTSYEKSYMEHDRLTDYDFWYAKWCLNGTDGVGKYVFDDQNPYERTPGAHIWQFSSYGNGSVLGTGSSRVDLDFCYYDYMGNGRSIYPYISPDPDDYAVPERIIDYATGAVTYGVDSAWVQVMLNVFGYQLEVDGSFGPASKRAVTSFQTAQKLEVTGTVNDATRERMVSLWNAMKNSLCKFSYEAGGANGVMAGTLLAAGDTFTFPECGFEREYYIFTGWTLERDTDGEYYPDAEGNRLHFMPGDTLETDSSWLFSGCKTGYTLRATWKCGHHYDDGVVTIKPTTTSDGEMMFTCSECGHVRYEVIPALVRGDADGDREVNMKDVLLLRKCIAGIERESVLSFDGADAYPDGVITMSDVLVVRKIVAGIY